ncbi:MAG: smpB [Rickettsiaceae bacterium]|jgi:SsrA-binding protein|nr:smpB [Rickettsiaceae bacterium]
MTQIASNRKARFNYHVEEEIEAGIMLLGSEVKSARDGKVNLNDGYAFEQNGELVLLNVHIAEYKGANKFNHAPMRPRKLLLHKKQIDKLLGKIKTKGISIIPLAMYFNKRNIVKVNLGICTGKKLHDKRAAIKERDERRSAARGEE